MSVGALLGLWRRLRVGFTRVRQMHGQQFADRIALLLLRLRRRPGNPNGLPGFAVLVCCAQIMLVQTVLAQTATPVGTEIINQASVRFLGSSGLEAVTVSNAVSTVTVVRRSSSAISFTRIAPSATVAEFAEPVGPSACLRSGAFDDLGDPIGIGGIPITADQAQPLISSLQHHGGEPLFIRLVDADQNLNISVRDYVTVTLSSVSNGDSEQIRLTETGPDTGVFAGFVPTANGAAISGDCLLQTSVNADLRVDYADPADATDTTSASVLVDPVSRVFDALTGLAVDGAIITLVDANSGLPAIVYADDGVSSFPASITSGGEIVDGAGNIVSFGPGEFRFPVVLPGDYRLDVQTPVGYIAPSAQPESALQSLANAPFVISAASYGLRFGLANAPVFSADIPLDPSAGNLFIDKRAMTEIAAPGDFVEFRLNVRHNGGREAADAVVLEDLLPPGLRYADGSARFEPAGGAIEPIISDDGRQLVFELGNIEPDAEITLRYVTVVVPGAGTGEVVNSASAISEQVRSNTARAAVRITNDFFTDSAFIAGRVVLGTCASEMLAEDLGLPGARIYLEDGRFAVTDENGRYHFEGLRPGMHTVQLDLESLPEYIEIVPCADTTRFAGTAFSRFIDLKPGALGRADFYTRLKPAPEGEVSVELRQSQRGDVFDYVATVATTKEIAPERTQLMIMLPDGVEYIAESGTLPGASAVDLRHDGQVLTIAFGTLAPASTHEFRFSAQAGDELDADLTTRALVRFRYEDKEQTTPVARTTSEVRAATQIAREYVLQLKFDTLSAELRPEDRAALDTIIAEWRGVDALRIEAVGHTDNRRISPASRHVFSDNYALSQARAGSVADYLQSALTIDPARIQITGMGPDTPIGDNNTESGRATNRRVELQIAGSVLDTPRSISIDEGDSGRRRVRVAGTGPTLPSMTVGTTRQDPVVPTRLTPEFEIASQSPGFAFLWPERDASLAIPTTQVIVKHAAGERVTIDLNGQRVSALNFDGVESSEVSSVALSRWRGLDLAEGPNLLRATLIRPDGSEMLLERELHFAGPPVRGEVVLPESVLVADGRTRPSIAVRFIDQWGRPARSGAVGQFSVDAPYRSWWEIQRLRQNSVIATGDRVPSFQIIENGLAYIELEPTTVSGEVTLRIDYAQEYPQDLRVRLAPVAREWILVGLVEGTLGHTRISDSMELASAAGFDDDYYNDGRLAFFAKGRIKGALLTAAFDSEGEDYDLDIPFGGVIDPNRYYTLYGDNTEQRFDAASRERLYLKIEKDTFMAMFGDYETGMTVTELARYSRTLTGLRAERSGERVDFTAFAADSRQGFVKDELRGDGTSGPYQLSGQAIIPGSDKLQIEIRDRFRPDRILSSETLERYFDYDIDYSAGTVFFREPIANRDFNFDPVYIVVDYESQDAANASPLFGGRAALAIGSGDSEVGVSYIHEGTAGAEGTLIGTDVRYDIGAGTQLRAEIANSEVETPGLGRSQAAAYLVEIEHQSRGRQIQAYTRETEIDFGLGQQRATESGTRRSGVQLRNEFSELWRLDVEAFRQENLRDGATRTVIESGGRFQDQRRVATAGIRRVDEDLGVEQRASTQAVVGGSWKLFEDLLTTRVNLETQISGDAESVDYPTRTIVGLDLAVGRRITLFGEREITDGDVFDARTTRIGARANPTDRSRIDTAFTSEMTEYGPRNFANLGMNQGFNIGDRWVLDVGFERSMMISEAPANRVDDQVPLASGSLAGDFTASFFGFGYRGEDWTLSNRIEVRDSAGDAHRALISGFYREPTSGRGFSAELNLIDRVSAAGFDSFDGRLSLGWARRPADSRWIIYNRADWTSSRLASQLSRTASQRIVNNFNAHFRPGIRHELAIQVAMKYVRSDFDGFTGSGILNLVGFDWRRRLTDRFDIGLHGSLYQAVEQDVSETGFGVDVGFAAAQNLLVTVGYNFSGFEDEDFSRARYTAQGPFARFSLKVDQASLRELLRR